MPAVGLLLLAVLLPAGAAVPTTDLPPAPSARVRVAVRYSPVPIAGTAWERTVATRAAAEKRARQKHPKKPKSHTPDKKKTDKPAPEQAAE
ncbi:hypothetical protein AAY84_10360 [Serratia marcescens]|nr:hypothetical protein AAY84_10360 [Serratia marcescens]